jgi:uncharacterized protein
MVSHVPKGAFVFDARDPGRRVGYMKSVAADVVTPSDMGTAVIGIVAGSTVHLDFTMQAVGEGILVTGSATAPIVGECSRCLAEIRYDEPIDLMALFTYPPTDSRGRAIAPQESEDGDDELWVTEDHIDLESTLTDAIVLDLPLAPLCQPDCPGLCPTCGLPLVDQPDHSHPQHDPRWEALATLAQPSSPDAPEVKED